MVRVDDQARRGVAPLLPLSPPTRQQQGHRSRRGHERSPVIACTTASRPISPAPPQPLPRAGELNAEDRGYQRSIFMRSRSAASSVAMPTVIVRR